MELMQRRLISGIDYWVLWRNRWLNWLNTSSASVITAPSIKHFQSTHLQQSPRNWDRSHTWPITPVGTLGLARTPSSAFYISTCRRGQTLSCSGIKVIKLLDRDSAELRDRHDSLSSLASYFRCFHKRTIRGLESPEVWSLPPVASSCCKPNGFFSFFVHPRALVQHGGRKIFVLLRRPLPPPRCSASVNRWDWTHGQPRLQPGRDPGRGHASLVQQVHARVSVRAHHSVRAEGHPQPEGHERERQQLRGPGLLHLRHGRGT